MATYTDKNINQGVGYKDTNVNVFMLGSLPLNDVFDFGGVQAFFDRTTALTHSFLDRKASYSEPILSQLRENILSQDEDYHIGYYRGALTNLRTVAGSDSFVKLKVAGADNFTKVTTNE
jgi:hypothetical protein